MRGGTVAAFIAIASAVAWSSIGLASCQKKGDVASAAPADPPHQSSRVLTVGDGWSMSVYTDPETGCEYLHSPYGLTPRVERNTGAGGFYIRGCR